ncbi:MAG: pirin family protein [Arcobacter sp.]|jgi:redox-sensitive bicupin YhaK (pirin superfamily)|uniref:pirin family protein n=1 Tax=unclassified Arcobacter TaxID=2593671 RepID=UPI0002296523|nr:MULTISPECIES: pirin family protein [unclassified Arcobacter]MDY3200282.1 pirin family protein [Arcobacter sp.]BAK72068.1 pirin [Arcobacter sp. L]
MLRKLPKEKMGTSNLGWLESRFHFSFAEYRNPNNINFGVLRVLNDDIVHPKSGFDTHPHSNMEIISYVINGEITHKDSMGNSETLKRGEVQYLSAGDGIYHSEHNLHESKDLRLLQIWIIPPKAGLPRLYGSHRFKEDERTNKLLNIVSSQKGDSKIKIYQDINIYVSEFDKEFDFDIKKDRQVYFVQIEGSSNINGVTLENGDAMEIVDIDKLNIKPLSKSHILFIDMQKK